MPIPFIVFLLIFVGVPLVELYLLIEVGSEIGAVPTIALSLFTAALGGWLVRMQGISILFRAQTQMAKREVPAFEMVEGVVVLLVGFALLLPGFITDAIGFLLLIPPLRRWLIVNWLRGRGALQPGPPPAQRSETRPDRVIEGDYERDD
jgi:UPF0716 protein FxsA